MNTPSHQRLGPMSSSTTANHMRSETYEGSAPESTERAGRRQSWDLRATVDEFGFEDVIDLDLCALKRYSDIAEDFMLN